MHRRYSPRVSPLSGDGTNYFLERDKMRVLKIDYYNSDETINWTDLDSDRIENMVHFKTCLNNGRYVIFNDKQRVDTVEQLHTFRVNHYRNRVNDAHNAIYTTVVCTEKSLASVKQINRDLEGAYEDQMRHFILEGSK